MMRPYWLDWRDAPPKGDAADLAGLGDDRATLQALLDAARPFDPEMVAERGDEEEVAEPWRLPTPFDAYEVPPFPTQVLPA